MQNYELRYLPLFYDDLSGIMDYININLSNSKAALELLYKVEQAILKRKDFAESFEPVKTKREWADKYYRIYVDNFVVLYVVLTDSNNNKTMEVRRILYYRQRLPSCL